MLATFCGAILTIIASLALGAGILAASGQRHPLRLAGGVGFAGLISAATVLVRLPGRAVTALTAIALLALAGAWRARHSRAPPRAVFAAALAALAVLVLLGLPFFAAGHFGPLGVSMDNDLGFHLGWVSALVTGPPPFRFLSFGYPLGSESLAAAVTRLGIGDEQALVGVAAAALALTTLTAWGALRRLPLALRAPVAVACGLPVLSAAFFGEGSFKEPILGLIVLTTALLVRDGPLRRQAPALVVLCAAALFVFGPPGLVLPVAFMLVRVLSERWHAPRSRAGLAVQLAIVASTLVVAAVVALGINAIGTRIGAGGFAIYPSGPPAGHYGGNFARQLPLTEGLGVWFGNDFRLPAQSGALSMAAVLLGVVMFVGAALGDLRRWRTALLLPAAASVVVYLAARQTTLPYFSAKLMVSAGPLLVVFAVTGILAWRDVPGGDGSRSWVRVAAPLVLAAGFAAAIIWSSADVLRSSPVDDPAFGAELASLQPIVNGHTVLFLGADQWSPQWLHGAGVRGFEVGHPFSPRRFKTPGAPLDFDSPAPTLLNTIDYVITTRTLDSSSPPVNWNLIRTTPHYQLFGRHGASAPRKILNEQMAPGASLDCTQAVGRDLAAQPGVAAVRAAPIASSPWRTASGAILAGRAGAAFLPARSIARATIRLPAGSFELSLPYWSALPITLRVAGATARLTPTLEPLGPLWRAGVISSRGGQIPVGLDVGGGHVPIPLDGAFAGTVYAVPAHGQDVILPLRAACGRYVDWYRLGR